MKAPVIGSTEQLAETIASKVISHLLAIVADSVRNKMNFIVIDKASPDSQEKDSITDTEGSLPTNGVSASVGEYKTIKEYSIHRKLCEKTVRNYLHLLPHSTVGGIRIKLIEADQVLDGLARPPRSRRKTNTKKENI